MSHKKEVTMPNENPYDDPSYLMAGIDALLEERRLEKEGREKREKEERERKESLEKAAEELEQMGAVWAKLGGKEGVEKFLRGETPVVPKPEPPKVEVVLEKKKEVVKRSPPRLKVVLIPTLSFLVLICILYSCLHLKIGNMHNEDLLQDVVGEGAGPSTPLPPFQQGEDTN